MTEIAGPADGSETTVGAATLVRCANAGSTARLVTIEDKKLDDMIKQYMSKGGTITKLPPALQKGSKPSDMKKHKVGDKGVVKSMKMKEVREFISTYNSHFLTNFKAEEFILKD